MDRVKLLIQRLSARDFERQVAQFQVRVIRGLPRTDSVARSFRKGFIALGTPITEVAG